ncbi:MAG TPA: chromosome segregation protein SMC [Firmicutes bacterium]|nr:chromosome segregation protein SMC [Bacillota bacterium]
MYLKYLELVGFKSFGKRVRMVFEPGLIAIVGPNGSGKSNVVDAIRWVLGEQSMKNLRGDQLDDVIFAGTKEARPLGKAKVELTLDNSSGLLPVEFAEVSVSRTVYRNGDSEFAINRQSCRLRDIQELFLGTGLGRDGYGIIGQGQVDAFLAASSTERRLVLEEVAGISLYQRKKAEALRRLEQTASTLVRVQDLLGELSRQLEPLRTEAERAREYARLQEELTKLELQIARTRIEQYRGEEGKLKEQLAAAKAQLDQVLGKLSQLKQSREQIKERAEELASTYESHRTRLYELRTALEKNAAALLMVEERQERYGEEQAAQREGVTRAQVRREELTACLQAVEERQQTLEVTQRELVAKKEEISVQRQGRQRDLAALERQLEEGQHQLTQYANQVAVLQEKLQTAQASQAEKQAHLDKLQAQEGELARELERAQARLAQWRQNLVDKEAKLADTENSVAHQTQLIQGGEATLVSLQAGLAKSREDLQRVRAQQRTLLDLQESSYFQGVRSVLKARLPGIIGTVGELLTVPAEYELALEVALGNNIQDIVVEHMEAALGAIDYLKKRRGGRATFLPLDVLQPEGPLRVESFPGLVGIAADLVEIDPQYQVVAQHLLGRVLIVERLEDAQPVLERLKRRPRIVTLDGDFISPSGSITGGTPRKERSGLLARRRRLVETQRELAELTNTINQLEIQRKEQEEILRQQRDQNEALRARREELLLAVQAAQHEVRSAQEHVDRVEEQLAKQRSERESWEEQESLLASSFAAYRRELAQVTEAHAGLLERLEAAKTAQQELRRVLEGLEREFTAVAVELAKVDEGLKKVRQDRERYNKELEALGQEIADRHRALAQLAAELEKAQGAKEEHQGRRIKLQEEEAATGNLLEELSGQQEKLGQEAKVLDDQIQAAEQEAAQLEQWTNKLTFNLREVSLRLEQLKEELGEKYGLSLEEVTKHPPLEGALDQARTQVSRLRAQLRELGTVDPSSIQRYEETQERYEFLSAQYRDLLDARGAIEKLIQRIQRECEVRFQKTFEQVKKEFSKTFRQLFNGGTAELRLVELEEGGTKGLELYVSPPGKRVQNINLLSGGERALTGIAFLMSVLRVRPTPFCILDEIDAALDEANLERFIRLVREMADKIQFLVITHRPATMEAADIVYGVTMQESGISKVISLRMTEAVS